MPPLMIKSPALVDIDAASPAAADSQPLARSPIAKAPDPAARSQPY